MVYTISGNSQCLEITDNEPKQSYWREIFLSFIVSIPFFTHGVETMSLTASVHAGHFVPQDAVSWTSSALIVATCASAPLFCYFSDRCGRKLGIFGITFAQGASLIPLFLESEANAIILHALAGISSGGIFTVLPIYIQEICSPQTRGHTLTWVMTMTSLGYMTKLVTSLEERLYLMVLLVMVQFVLMIFVLETPSYLVMKDKIEKTKCNICRLKGLRGDDPKLNALLAELQKEKERSTASGNFTITTLYRNKIWWDSLKIAVVLYTIMTLCGSIVFLDQQKTFQQLQSPSDPVNVVVLGAMLAGAIWAVSSVALVDHKYMLTFGLSTMAIASGIVAVYTQVDVQISHRWVPVMALTLLVFGYGACWALPALVAVQIFNTQLRAPLLGVLLCYSQILKLIHVHTFRQIEDYVGIYPLFYVFAGINLYGAVYSLFVVPNFKGKSVGQVEKQLKRTPLPA